jgi:hypothetical protein
MPKRSLRFGIHDGSKNRASTWKLWTEFGRGNSEVYLANRSLGGTLKASLHQSGNWHIAYSQKTFEERVKGTIPKFKDRFIEKWPRPNEIAHGITLAFRIVTPSSALTSSKDHGKYAKVKWIDNAPALKATEVDIIITKPEVSGSGWPGKQTMGTSLIGSFQLENKETIWAVSWIIDMPDLSKIGKGVGKFFRGKSKENLETDGLRALVFGTEADGSRVIYDCAVQSKTANKAN